MSRLQRASDLQACAVATITVDGSAVSSVCTDSAGRPFNSELTALSEQTAPRKAQKLDDPSGLISRYWERRAVLEEDSACTDPISWAIIEAGDTIAGLAARQVKFWRACLEDMQADHPSSGLREALIADTNSKWMRTAASLGWTDQALFGINPYDRTGDPAAWGLAIARHWYPMAAITPLEVVRIFAGTARLRSANGQMVGFDRFAAAVDRAVPLWTVLASQK
jgi:hypothetical protein